MRGETSKPTASIHKIVKLEGTSMSATAEGPGAPVDVEAVFTPDRLEVSSELTTRFARAVNDHNPWYLETEGSQGVIAPPMFGIVPAMRIMRLAELDGRFHLDENRMLHGEQDMHFVSPIRSGDVLITSGWISGIQERSTGSTLDMQIRTDTLEGQERVRQRLTLFIKGETEGSAHGPAETEADLENGQELLDRVSMEVAQDQTYRYARASFTEGIRVHEDEEYAQTLGYRTMFLQGQCTMAFAAKAIVDSVADGDPRLLRRLEVRFASQVYPGDVVTTEIFRTDSSRRYVFRSLNRGGSVVLKNGAAEFDRDH